jgi:hypothetical protein
MHLGFPREHEKDNFCQLVGVDKTLQAARPFSWLTVKIPNRTNRYGSQQLVDMQLIEVKESDGDKIYTITPKGEKFLADFYELQKATL